MSAPLPTYTVEQLAPGSYDVLLDGALVAALDWLGIHERGITDAQVG